jgi:hypothetical protein
MRRRTALVAVVASACGAPSSQLYNAGMKEDEGHGELAQASSKLMILEEEGVYAIAARQRSEAKRVNVEDDVAAAYGSDTYGGDPYGGSNYAGNASNWQYQYANRVPRYNAVTGLTGAIEGTISWRGAVPAKRTTACGAIEVAAIGADRGVGDVLVYVENVTTGRMMPMDSGRPASVGGLVVKRNCALVPAVQIMTPLPAALSLHGDAKPTKLKVTPLTGTARTIDLEAAGRSSLQINDETLMRIDAADQSLASAWVHALATSYYAITDDRGRFRIDELAAGTYEVTIWHAPIFVDGKYGPPLVVKRKVTVGDKKTARLDATIGQ